MAERLDALVARENNGKTFWNRVGVAFPTKDGLGYNVILEVMPLPQDGQIKFSLFPPKPKQDQQQSRGGRYGGGTAFDNGKDDLPFRQQVD